MHTYFTLFISLIFSSFTYSLQEDQYQPINLEADNATIDQKKGISTYTGNVVLKQGSLMIHANKISLIQHKKTLQKIRITGNPAKFQQTEENGTLVQAGGKKMTYNVTKNTILLEIKAYLTQGNNSIRGKSILYNTLQSKLSASSISSTDEGRKERIEIQIQPQKIKETL